MSQTIAEQTKTYIGGSAGSAPLLDITVKLDNFTDLEARALANYVVNIRNALYNLLNNTTYLNDTAYSNNANADQIAIVNHWFWNNASGPGSESVPIDPTSLTGAALAAYRTNIRRRQLSAGNPSSLKTIRNVCQAVLDGLNNHPTWFKYNKGPTSEFDGLDIAASGFAARCDPWGVADFIEVYPPFYEINRVGEDQLTGIFHELTHFYGGTVDHGYLDLETYYDGTPVQWNDVNSPVYYTNEVTGKPQPLSTAQMLANADSYACFLGQIIYHPPRTQPSET